MHNENLTVGEEQVSHDTIEAISKLTLSGSAPEAISLALDLTVQTVMQVIARGDFVTLCKDLDQERNQCKQAQLAQGLRTFHAHSEAPTFIYSYRCNTDELHRASLVTGEHSSHRVPSDTFKPYCCWRRHSFSKGGSED
jgi:hypothetical protein